jgi:hypothetical protein
MRETIPIALRLELELYINVDLNFAAFKLTTVQMIELPLYVSYGKQDAAYFALQRED